MAADNRLGLILPKRSPPTGDVLLRPKDVSAWIQRLPMASGPESAQKLARALQDLNRSQVPPATRVQLAELFAPAVSGAVDTLQRHFLEVAFPLSEKGREMEALCARLHDEMASAYKIAVSDIVAGPVGTQERRILAIALFRAVGHLSDRIGQTALVYQDCPGNLWHDLHGLFVFADTNELSGIRVKLLEGGEGRVATLQDLYLRTLLLAAASPHRLRQQEIRLARQALDEWGGLVRLAPFRGGTASATCFVVQLKQDRPPLHASLVDGRVEMPALELDTGPLVHKLREIFDGLPPETEGGQRGGGVDRLSRSGIRTLIQALGTAPKRQFVRTRLNFELTLAVGLATVHRLLNGGDGGPAQPLAAAADGGSRAGIGGAELTLDSGFDLDSLDEERNLALVPLEEDSRLYPGHDASDARPGRGRRAKTAIWPDVGKPAESGATNTLRTLNESAGGYCVNWEGRRLPGVKIGELIGIQSSGGSGQYGVAAVRWMRHIPREGLQLGLQLIALSALAVTATVSGERRQEPTRCLLVPELKTVGRPASLITPILPFKIGQVLNLKHEDTDQPVRLVRLLEATGTFAQFQFEYA